MSKINEGEVLTKLTGMLNDSYMRGYQDALNTKLTEQPKLSIPKKIAEEIQLFLEEYDIEDKALFLIKEYHGAFGTFFSDDFRKWANDPLANNRSAKIIAYINPLTRKLVEVEG